MTEFACYLSSNFYLNSVVVVFLLSGAQILSKMIELGKLTEEFWPLLSIY